MAEPIVRCLYCVLGNEFRPMIERSEGWFICQSCGHTAMPLRPGYACLCQKCRELSNGA